MLMAWRRSAEQRTKVDREDDVASDGDGNYGDALSVILEYLVFKGRGPVDVSSGRDGQVDLCSLGAATSGVFRDGRSGQGVDSGRVYRRSGVTLKNLLVGSCACK